MIRLAGVSRTFEGRSGRVEALRGIDLDVAEGEFVAVLGRSGCGKSTLLRLIAGLLPLTAGEITVAGDADHRPAPGRRHDVPAAGAAALALGAGQRPAAGGDLRLGPRRAPRAGPAAARPGRAGRLREAAAARALRRHAAAGVAVPVADRRARR